MKTLIIAIALILGACGFGYADPGTWNGSHKPVNHIEMMLHHESTQPTGDITIPGLVKSGLDQQGFTKTTTFIGSANLAHEIGADK